MFNTNENQFFESALFQSLGTQLEVRSMQFVSGGNINNTVKLVTDQGPFFLKWNEDQDSDDLFEKEERGLSLLRHANDLATPQVLGRGKVGLKNYLLQEFIEKNAPKSTFWEDFGHGLATQHQKTMDQFGLNHDNHIGKLPQKNEPRDNWIDFFIENRLEVQLGLAIYNRYIDQSFAKKFRTVYPQLPGMLPDEPPALLHGDLWSGNFMVGPEGNPYIFDPAVYYGHREIELAFTRLFGGFDPQFYHSYHEAFPLEPGFEERVDIYNLYPLLVHVNLFGTSYLSGVERTIHRLK